MNDNKEPNMNKNDDNNYILPPVVDRSIEVAIYASTFSQVFGMTRNGEAATRAAQEAVLAHYQAITNPQKVKRGPGRPRKTELKAA